MTKDEKTQKKYYVTAFYKFFDWPKNQTIEEHSKLLEKWCIDHSIKGLVIASCEGFNGTVSSPDELNELKSHLTGLAGSEVNFKDSFAEASNPFRRMKVKVRNEIVTLGKTEISPKNENPKGVKHISPKEWHEFMENNPDAQIVDVRNDFEVELGTFKNAKNWKMNSFTEFPELTKKTDFKKEKPVLMFCTGGIRCEKASLEMSEQGFGDVYQLDGGILNYLAEFPNKNFEGECFVFDHRVAVDQNLDPTTKHDLCIHCGDPSGKEVFLCVQCKNESYGVCQKCWNKEEKLHTCSKNCAHHFEHGHKTKALHKDSKRIKYK